MPCKMHSIDNGRALPKRIILVRHGESQGNIDDTAYCSTPDHRIPLTSAGLDQALAVGSKLSSLLSSSSFKIFFFVSPYERTKSTLRQIGKSFPKYRIIGVREECRLREQDFGNFQEPERMKAIKKAREKFGRFFFRFPNGESAADVFDRVSGFLESLWRDIDMNRLHCEAADELNFVIVSHGLASRVFLMKWFKWTVEQFEGLNNLGHCEFRVMQLGDGGDYSLAIHHSDQELSDWGLTKEMIADQKWRALRNKEMWNDRSFNYSFDFFDADEEEK